MMMQEMIHMVMAGVTFFGIKHAFGTSIHRFTTNFLGQKRGEIANILVYFTGFFYFMHKMNQIERNDINYLVNPREMSGELYTNTCLHMFPAKVNLEMYRTIMMEKQ